MTNPPANPPPRRRFRLISPVGFPCVALVLGLAFAVCHLAGMRADVSALLGTTFTGDGSQTGHQARGAIYALFFFLSVLVAPIFLLAAGIFAALQLALNRRASPKAPATDPSSPPVSRPQDRK